MGLYGVIAFAVSQRTRELALRVAIGARTGQVVAMVVREALTLVLIGGFVGLVIVAAASVPLSHALYGMRPFDPVALAGVSVLFGAVACLASYVPARRARLVNPMEVLKRE